MTIKKNIGNIRDECDEIEEKIDGDVEEKNVRTFGDPIVQFRE